MSAGGTEREGEAPAEPGFTVDLGSAGASPSQGSQRLPQRRHPTHGVRVNSFQATLVFLTVCTKDRQPWLATSDAHGLLVATWQNALAWSVGRYVVMPDHIHLFATPGTPAMPLENWVRFWKSQFSKKHMNAAHRWQPDHWDYRLRSGDSYEEKWEYVRKNPVRQGLVQRVEDWPFQGELNRLVW
jgi:putative transposase